MLTITIKQGKEKSLLQGDRLIYVSAIDKVDGKPGERLQSGGTALVQTSSGQFLARAGFSPKSQIRARVWSFDPNEPIDHAFIKRRVKAAIAKRRPAAGKAPVAGRALSLIKGDEDGLPGLLVDWYAAAPGYLICQFLAAGVDAWKVPIVQTLLAETGCRNVYERSDPLMRKAEDLPDVSGALAGDEPPYDMDITEKGVRYLLNLRTGEKRKFG
jgi:23S rRNA (cytosine1962-C5)-methyltransferase